MIPISLRLLFKLINQDHLNDPDTALGKQYSLATNILEELTKDQGMLDSAENSLSAADRIIDSLIGWDGVISKWNNMRDNITGWIVAINIALYWDKVFNIFDYWLPSGESRLDQLIDIFYYALEKLDTGATDMRRELNKIDSHIPTIKQALTNINVEFEKFSSETADPDYHALVNSIDSLEQAIRTIVIALPDLKTALNDKFIPGLINLEKTLQLYDDFHNGRWYSELSSYLSGALGNGILGISVDESRQLKGVVSEYRALLADDLMPLIDKSINVDIADLISKLSSDSETDRADAAEKMAGLIKSGVALLGTFQATVNIHQWTLSSLAPGWWGVDFGMETPLSPVSKALTSTANSMSDINLSINAIQTALRDAKDDNYATWEDLLSWEINQVHHIKDQWIVEFLATGAAKSYDLNQTKVDECLLKNTQLLEYFQNQINRTENGSITLPSDNELTTGEGGCDRVLNNFINALVDYMVPMSETNLETGKTGSEDVNYGLYGVSGFGSQMFNLKYPDTGVKPGRYKKCISENDPDFSQHNYDHTNRPTKYYSIVGNRLREDDNFSDRLLLNMVASANNSAKEDTLDNFVEALTSLTLIDRSKGIPSDESKEDIDKLSKNTDIVVNICSQELGEVFSQNGDYTHNLNHAQVVNQSLMPLFVKDLIQLFMGEKVENYVSIDTELRECNEEDTVLERKQCLTDLFPRIIIMYATGIVIDGMADKNANLSLDIFDLLQAIFKQDVGAQEFRDFVPRLYKQHLQALQLAS